MVTTKNHPRKKAAKRNRTGKTKTSKAGTGQSTQKWSAGVTKHSNALDLEKGVFTSGDPKTIARSLERSANRSSRKKAGSYQSAMSMLNFYINRAGKNLSAAKKKVLIRAKDELKAKHEKEKKA